MAQDTVWVLESPINVVEGASPKFAITISNPSSSTPPALSNPSTKIYKNGTDVSATCLTGSSSVTGNVVILPTIGSLQGDNVYVVAVTVDIDNVTDVKKIQLIVQRPGQEQ